MNVKATKVSELFSDYLRQGGIIPEYQRDFVWGQSECLTLLEDISEFNSVYMGPMVVQTVDQGKRCPIVDGQQRLTTLSLALHAINQLARFGASKAEDAVATHIFDTVQNKTGIYAIEKSDGKHFLAHELDKERRAYLKCIERPLGTDPAGPVDSRILKAMDTCITFAVEITLNESFNNYQEVINKGVLTQEDQWSKDAAERLDQLTEQVLKSKITVIEVGDNESAFKVFERLNSTGIRLSAVDLIKTAVMDRSYQLNPDNPKKDFEIIKEEWSAMCSYFANMPKFVGAEESLKCCLISYNYGLFNSVEKKDLYSKTKAFIGDFQRPEDCKNFVEALKDQAGLLHQLVNKDFEDNNFVKHPLPLLRANRMKAPLSAILHTRHKLGEDYAEAAAQFAFNLLFRVNTIKGDKRIAKKVRDLINNVVNSSPSSVDQFKDHLRQRAASESLDIKDSHLKNLIKEHYFENAKNAAKTILVICESDEISPEFPVSDFSLIELEHILPQSPSRHWGDYLVSSDPELRIKDVYDPTGLLDPERESLVMRQIHSIGNCALLYTKHNKKASDKSYHDKKKHYETWDPDAKIGSIMTYTNSVVASSPQQWTEEDIDRRADQIAERFVLLVPSVESN